MKRILTLAFVSILGGLVVHIGVFYFIRIEFPSPRSAPEDPVQVHYVGNSGIRVNPALGEQAFLQDSAPLFMPTKWNLVSQMDDVASLREATEVFSQYEPILTLPDSSPATISLPPFGSAPPEIALPAGPAFYLSRFGRQPTAPLPSIVSETSLQSIPLGERVDHSLRVSALPDSLRQLSPEALWPPIRFYLHLVHEIPLGKPVISGSSGFTDWDQALQGYIGSLDYYRGLPSGYYRITVYP
ncbi:hypothetical protein G0Q06_09215 [Puniceicoccales bacterium CK1056]|uniref:Uncharacterized protein n=1 Tax=Oceanipulchritudo coccoides TaxID=2706888 RepID=A0A6B2M348_9BACT|nr:hypothetical protein [Oceanipulchritudo coccoides]NDV62629.1 hypothetical protein [Oceanipulchritudo coccoides]